MTRFAPSAGGQHAWDVILLVCAAMAGELGCGGLSWAVTGSVGLLAPLAGIAVGIGLGLVARVQQRKDWLQRETLKRLARDVSALHAVVFAAFWVWLDVQVEAPRLVGATVMGVLMGFLTLLNVLCVGDVVAMVFCPFPDLPRSKRPQGPWRRR